MRRVIAPIEADEERYAGLGQHLGARIDLAEVEVDRLVRGGAPIDAFGIGTRMGVSADAPYLDSAYKLVEYDGRPILKLSAQKVTEPGRKQVFRGPDGEHRVRVDGPVRSDGTMIQRQAVLDGLGIADLPDYVVRYDLQAGTLVAVLTEYRTRPLELWAVHPPAGTLAARVRSFVDHVAKQLTMPAPPVCLPG